MRCWALRALRRAAWAAVTVVAANSVGRRPITDGVSPCKSLASSGLMARECGKDGAACGCRWDPSKNAHSRYAVFLNGGPRTFEITFWSLQRFVLEQNAPIDLFAVFSHGEKDAASLAIIREHSTAFISLPELAVPIADMNDPMEPARMLWQWRTARDAFQLAMEYAAARGHSYEFVIRSRPDQMYYTPLRLDALLAEYQGLGLYRPYFNTKGFEQPSEDERKSLPPERLPVGAKAPLFFPPCCAFLGLNDRFFMGPPEYVGELLSPEFHDDFRKIDRTVAFRLRPDAINPNYTFRVSNGFEKLLKDFVRWRNFPVAELPLEGPHAFLFGLLRPDAIHAYCLGDWLDFGYWTHTQCLAKAGKDVVYNATEFLEDQRAANWCEAYTDQFYEKDRRRNRSAGRWAA